MTSPYFDSPGKIDPRRDANRVQEMVPIMSGTLAVSHLVFVSLNVLEKVVVETLNIII